MPGDDMERRHLRRAEQRLVEAELRVSRQRLHVAALGSGDARLPGGSAFLRVLETHLSEIAAFRDMILLRLRQQRPERTS